MVGRDGKRNNQIWLVSCPGGEARKITNDLNYSVGRNSQPSLSPDGRWVVYTSERDGKPTLWRVSIDGGEATQLTDRLSLCPQISPDGKHIAYEV